VKRCGRCKYPVSDGKTCPCRKRNRINEALLRKVEFVPTPEQIREGCRAIQATWSEAEEQRRNTRPARGWQPPEGRYTESEQGPS
jgi:hypothetical protein